MDVKGTTAIVTGASRGIGRQIAIALGARGANVVVAARTVEPHRRLPGTIGETVELVEQAGGQALAVATDVGDPQALAALATAAIDRFGPVRVLVNNAVATGSPNPVFLEITRDEWLHQFDVNVHAPFLLTAAAVPSMRDAAGGVVVNISSGAGDLAQGPLRAPGEATRATVGARVAYSTTKAALNRLGNVIAPELAGMGIAVVTVDPGFTRTESVALMGEDGHLDAGAAKPMALTVKTVLHAVTCDDPMRYTGQILRSAAFVEENQL